MTDREKLEALIDRIEAVIPYVTATIGVPGLGRPVKTTDPEWIGIHGGRATSSYRQLELLLKEARSFK